MNLKFNLTVAEGYKSQSQIARVLTEKWVGQNIYCPACGNKSLDNFENNSPVADFYCTSCKAEYELKSKKDSNAKKIVDGAFSTMIERINSNNNPNFFFLNYKSSTYSVKSFFVIPKHYFVNEIIEKRKPLGPQARRAGWVGCNILLDRIPSSGKIYYIKNEEVIEPEIVLKSWSKTKFLSTQKQTKRGWTIEIMKLIDKMEDGDFYLKDIYRFDNQLQEKFPDNNFIRAKIRQQLQVLRDANYIDFLGNGHYQKNK